MRIVVTLIVLSVIAYLTVQQMGGTSDSEPVAGTPTIAVEPGVVALTSLTPTPGQPAPSGYTLRVALEADAAAAQRVAGSLANSSEAVRIVRVTDSGVERFLVVVGQYERLDQAQIAQAGLMARVGMQRPVTVILSP
jgi:sporulation related protein